MTTDAPRREPSDYPVVERDDARIRAYRVDVVEHLGSPLVDVRSPDESTGRLLHMANYPQEGALRGGHIPGARNVPWARAANEDGTFKSRSELEQLYQREIGLAPTDDVVVYDAVGCANPPAFHPTFGGDLTQALSVAGQEGGCPSIPAQIIGPSR